jgi:hypothetical protein
VRQQPLDIEAEIEIKLRPIQHEVID